MSCFRRKSLRLDAWSFSRSFTSNIGASMHPSSLLQVAHRCQCHFLLLKTSCPALSSGTVLSSAGQVLGPKSFQCDRRFLFKTPAAQAHCNHCFSDGTGSGQSLIYFRQPLSLWLFSCMHFIFDGINFCLVLLVLLIMNLTCAGGSYELVFRGVHAEML